MATGANDAQGIWQYGEDDSNATFSALLNRLGTSTSTQFGADRTRLSALETVNASTNKSGLVPVIPTSVNVNAGSGSFNSTTGKITFGSGSSTVSLNGVFTSAYTNYVIVVNIWASGANNAINTRFRLSGSDYSYFAYQVVYVETEAGTTTQAFTSAANTNLPRLARSSQTGGAGIVMDVTAPQAATPSRIMCNTQDSTYTARSGITYSGNDQFDGISIIAGAAITGDIQVYGRR